MIRSGREKVILVHGLPKGGPDESAAAQLSAVEANLKSRGFGTISFDWGTLLGLGFNGTVRLLKRDQFVSTFAERFTQWLHTERTERELREASRCLLVTYSLGGLGFYGWVTRPETEKSDRDKITLALTVASPHQFSTGQVDIHGKQQRHV